MKNGSYHHGNLKAELIERGLEYIDRYGSETLSMRKLADAAGVSCAAPYAHFKNKEAFLGSVQEYITEKFLDALTESEKNCADRSSVMLDLGSSYVKFFYSNPLYYKFLFNGRVSDLKTYEPFVFFEKVAEEWMASFSGAFENSDSGHYMTLALWSMVHGLAQMVTINGVIDTEHLETEIAGILGSVRIGERK